MPAELSREYDLIFIASFTRAAPLAYAVSKYCRGRGAVTVLGGPHARCFPDDARKHFDYVLGLTDSCARMAHLAGPPIAQTRPNTALDNSLWQLKLRADSGTLNP